MILSEAIKIGKLPEFIAQEVARKGADRPWYPGVKRGL